MSEKPPSFVVNDRRKFTAEGEIREGYTPPPVEVFPTAPEPAAEALSEVVSSARIVTMPTRSTVEADDHGTAGDLREEVRVQAAVDHEALADYDVDGDGLSSEDEAAYGDGPQPTAAEASAQHAAYQHLTGTLDAMLQKANPGKGLPPAIGFPHLVQSFYLSAMVALGAGAEPGQQPQVDILGARQSIDMLGVLDEKTRGNLDENEQRLLRSATFEIRMAFLEVTNALAKQMSQAPPAGGPTAGGMPPAGRVPPAGRR